MPTALTGSATLCGLALLLAACAAPRPPTAARNAPKSATSSLVTNATIVVVRPVTEQELAESARWRAILLRGADPGATPDRSRLVEVVVREDSGRTLALIEPPQAGCAAGSRVLVLPGEPARCPGF